MESLSNSFGKKKIYSKNTNLYRFYKINENVQVRVPNLPNEDIRVRIRTLDNTEIDTTQNSTSNSDTLDNTEIHTTQNSTSNSDDNQSETFVHNFLRERPYLRNFNLEHKSNMVFIISY